MIPGPKLKQLIDGLLTFEVFDTHGSLVAFFRASEKLSRYWSNVGEGQAFHRTFEIVTYLESRGALADLLDELKEEYVARGEEIDKLKALIAP